MEILLALSMFLFAYQVRASDEKTVYTCSQGDYYISLKLSTNRQILKAGICEFSSCAGDMTRTGRLQSTDSEGNRKVYEVDGPEDDQLVLFFDAKGDVLEVHQFEDGIMIQRFDDCRVN